MLRLPRPWFATESLGGLVESSVTLRVPPDAAPRLEAPESASRAGPPVFLDACADPPNPGDCLLL